jgi:hypothetical protein
MMSIISGAWVTAKYFTGGRAVDQAVRGIHRRHE